ncbi:MAG: NPCBM/NEW2 domain-containing protein [Proteobacteria bacterium]|nr:NPCBM/NEW2 domain-containing protein [Pseudomonadota bacterium]
MLRLIGRHGPLLVAAMLLPAAAASGKHSRAGRTDGLEATGHWSHRKVGSAETPPMGWNSWNAFGTAITEAKVIGSAEVIRASGLAEAGYRSINLDDGWWLKRRASDGRMQVRTNLFPSAAVGGREGTSLRPFTDRLHAMGLRAGIYTDIGRNACSQAWSSDNPNLPEGTVAEREVGLYGHAEPDLALYFRDWNFDYLKVDACGIAHYAATRPQVTQGRFRALAPLVVDADANRSDIPAVRALYAQVRDALRRLRPANDFVLSLCNWGSANVRAWGKDFGTIWRTSNDIDPTWGRMLHNFDSVATRELYAGPGHWNDPDMLEVGNGTFDAAHPVEAQAHMSLWAIAAAPLVIGTDLTRADPRTIATLGNREVIAVDQDSAGNQGVIAYTDDEREIVVKSLAGHGAKAVVLLNRTAEPTDIMLTAAHLKFAGDRPTVLRDLWAHADIGDLGGQRSFRLAPHQALMLLARGTPERGSGLYLSEMPGRINVAVDGITALEPDPLIHRMVDPYHPGTTWTGNRPAYAGWGGPRADATPYGQDLRVAGVAYRSGLGVLANSRLEARVERGFRRFSARVGLDDSTRGTRAAVRFELYGDGRRLALSPPMRFNQPAAELTAEIAGVRVLELVVRQLGPANGNVVASWAEARVD